MTKRRSQLTSRVCLARIIPSAVVHRAEFEADLPRIFAAMDQPTIDGVNTWFVSKAARERGLKVALSGLGGDELFGGYPSFRDLPRWVGALRLPGQLPGLGLAFRHCLWVMAQFTRPTNPKAAGLFEYGGSYPGAYLLRRGLFMPWELAGLLGEELAQEGLAKARSACPYCGGAVARSRAFLCARCRARSLLLYAQPASA